MRDRLEEEELREVRLGVDRDVELRLLVERDEPKLLRLLELRLRLLELRLLELDRLEPPDWTELRLLELRLRLWASKPSGRARSREIKTTKTVKGR